MIRFHERFARLVLDHRAPGSNHAARGGRVAFYYRHAMGLDLARHGSAPMKAVEGFP